MSAAPALLGHILCKGKKFHNGDLKGIKRRRSLHTVKKYGLSLVKIAPEKVSKKISIKANSPFSLAETCRECEES
jgi:hypothetical protein